MKQQSSILSFFQKPPPPSVAIDSPVTGTETPPEKIPRPLLHHSFPRAALPVSSIMRKLERGCDSNDYGNGNSEASKGHAVDVNGGMLANVPLGSISKSGSGSFDLRNEKLPDAELCVDEFGPETPMMRPLFPRLKRVKGDVGDAIEQKSIVFSESCKRLKTSLEFGSMEKEQRTPGSLEITGSKFEWLNPSNIRDANGRKPNDPCYDKTTLYIPDTALSKMSATQKQYWEVKRQYMDILIFFKVGKFYELYEMDAEIGQKELDWKMTHSGVGKCRQVGISESGIDDAVQKLVARGYKVGRVEQLETSDQAKSRGASSVIQRKLVQVSCPATTTDGSLGVDAVHLLALKQGNWMLDNSPVIFGFAFLDYAALKLWAGCIRDDSSYSALGTLLVQISPKELVYENEGISKETLKAIRKYASTGCRSLQFTPTSGTHFLCASEVKRFINSRGYFRGSFESWVSTIECQIGHDVALCALGELVDHLSRLKLDDALCNGDLLPYHVYKCGLKMDGQTLVNLEIFNNNIDGTSSGTLYKHLDRCLTSSGKRLLRKWICNPLRSVEEINKRLNVVDGLLSNPGICSVISEYLRRLPDLERLLGRVKSSIGSSAVLLLPTVGEKLFKQQVKSFGSLVKGLRVGLELLNILVKEDRISSSFSLVLSFPNLDELDGFLNHFEVAVDDVFPHCQDPDVGDTDTDALSGLIVPFTEKMEEWSQVIHCLNCVDVLLAFASTSHSSRGSMSRPVILPVDHLPLRSGQENHARVLKMSGLWHPYAVVENCGPVVPNDICLGDDSNGCHPPTLLLTGPNMGGKSTLLRATCLAVILAQLGCFVPCDSCVLSPADVIFTRLGAMDRIMSGESTFFIECAETASILKNATKDSLVLLDELGRGTSTFDGYAIAYAVLRHLVEKVHCRLLFATHYHPLTREFASHPLVSLQHMACAFRPKTSGSLDGEQELFFLYRLTPGACPESYGLQVALMAGIPDCVVGAASRARETMKAMIGKNFKSSESRSEFSSFHEECLKALLAISHDGDYADEDYVDTLLCLWHEAKSLPRGDN